MSCQKTRVGLIPTRERDCGSDFARVTIVVKKKLRKLGAKYVLYNWGQSSPLVWTISRGRAMIRVWTDFVVARSESDLNSTSACAEPERVRRPGI
jgi:hypothetical protein